MAFVLLASTMIQHVYTAKIQWGYEEVDPFQHWVHAYPECGRYRQSPIDITINDDTLNCNEPIILEWESNNEHFVIRNNGHSLQAIPFEITYEGGSDFSNLEVLHHTNDTNIRLKNSFYNTYKSPVNSEYCFDSLHFHWGDNNEFGSEHTINGQHYALEVHLVFYSCDYYLAGDAFNAYSNGEAAEKYDDNNVLAVIGVLFEIGEANPVLDVILDDVDGVHKYHDPENKDDNILELYYTEFDMMGLLPSDMQIIGYLGSLTTPPCYETVRWNVMSTPMTVSQSQLDAFRRILKSSDINDTMAPNFRPLQDLNGRKIYQCQEMVDAQHKEKEYVVPDESDNTDTTWFIIALILCCLFAVALIVIGLLIKMVYHKTDHEHVDREKDHEIIGDKEYRQTICSMTIEEEQRCINMDDNAENEENEENAENGDIGPRGRKVTINKL